MENFNNLRKIMGMGDAKVADRAMDKLTRQLSVDDQIQKDYPTYGKLVEDSAGADFRNDPPTIPMKPDFFGSGEHEDRSKARSYPSDELLHRALLNTKDNAKPVPKDDEYYSANKMYHSREALGDGAGEALVQDIYSKDPEFNKIGRKNNYRGLIDYLAKDKVLNPNQVPAPDQMIKDGKSSFDGSYSPNNDQITLMPDNHDNKMGSLVGTAVHELNHQYNDKLGIKDGNDRSYVQPSFLGPFIHKNTPDSFLSNNSEGDTKETYVPPMRTPTMYGNKVNPYVDSAVNAGDPELYKSFFAGHDGKYDDSALRKSMERLYGELPAKGFVQKPIAEQSELDSVRSLEPIIKDLNAKRFANTRSLLNLEPKARGLSSVEPKPKVDNGAELQDLINQMAKNGVGEVRPKKPKK